MNGRGRVDVGRYKDGNGDFEEGQKIGIEGLVGRRKG